MLQLAHLPCFAAYKLSEEWKKLTLHPKLGVEKDVEDKPVVKDDMAAG